MQIPDDLRSKPRRNPAKPKLVFSHPSLPANPFAGPTDPLLADPGLESDLVLIRKALPPVLGSPTRITYERRAKEEDLRVFLALGQLLITECIQRRPLRNVSADGRAAVL